MRDFAAKLPRLAEMASALKDGDETAPLVEAALVDIPALGWAAPYTLLALVARVVETRKAAGSGRGVVVFDEHGNGPNCGHGFFPFFCPTCCAARKAEEHLVAKLHALAGSQ